MAADETETLLCPAVTSPTNLSALTTATTTTTTTTTTAATTAAASYADRKRSLDAASADWDTDLTSAFPFSGPRSKARCSAAGACASSASHASPPPPPHARRDDVSDAARNPPPPEPDARRHPSADPSSPACVGVEEACKRALLHFPTPSISFPVPTLEFDFRIAVALNPEPVRVENRVKKEISTISTGSWSGSFGNGRVIAGGYDLGQARGFRPIRIVEGAFVLQTTDEPPAILEMRTRGSLSGPCDLLDSLLGLRQPQDVDPRRYAFRMFATVKTPDKRYGDIVNCGLWVASGVWRAEQLIIE
ncbi:hypothetical protein RJ55_02150 [Drechmeria coniospora]|nr:hypothetical protein RJ55_02150 [Drechmeria coniospora]